MSNEFPRRNRIDLFTPAETAIWKAKQAVEEAGCHPLLTEAVILLGQAQDKVADYVESQHVDLQKISDTPKFSGSFGDDW